MDILSACPGFCNYYFVNFVKKMSARSVAAIVKFQFGGESLLTIRARQAGNIRNAIGPSRFLTASVKLQFIEQILSISVSAQILFRCSFLVSEQERNQRNRHRGGAVRRFAPAPEPIRKGMIAPGNHCIERFAALCNTLPYVPLPARTWHLRSTLTSLDYRFPGLSVAGAPLSLPCRFYPYSPCMAKIGTFLPCSGCRLRCSEVSLVRPGIS